MNFLKEHLNLHIFFELIPGFLFLVTHFLFGIIWATAVVVISTIIFTIADSIIEKRIPVFPLVTVIMVFILGTITLVLQDEFFIKVEPSLVKCLFALILFIGSFMRPSLLERALYGQVYLSERGWKVLTNRWIIFALFLAVMNILIWRMWGTNIWVVFKACLTPVSIIGYIIITRYTAPNYWTSPQKTVV